MPTHPETLKRLRARRERLRSEGKLPGAKDLGEVSSLPKKPAVPARFLKPLACVHRGPATGASHPCAACGGRKVPEPEYACALHGVCTAGRLVAGVACCRVCPDRAVPSAGQSPGGSA